MGEWRFLLSRPNKLGRGTHSRAGLKWADGGSCYLRSPGARDRGSRSFVVGGFRLVLPHPSRARMGHPFSVVNAGTKSNRRSLVALLLGMTTGWGGFVLSPVSESRPGAPVLLCGCNRGSNSRSCYPTLTS